MQARLLNTTGNYKVFIRNIKTLADINAQIAKNEHVRAAKYYFAKFSPTSHIYSLRNVISFFPAARGFFHHRLPFY
ncbi:hypothetical protein BK796_04805 [Kosakonia pseudosacchari]|uniref:Uncharacterized protein n=1 Tax=Kosakonia pseudosacchari TaxID=1646340 RepID=A0ABX4ITN2_9ENTR|nr:hypothetical protein BK796_04805 [Kosakonia pseudosacchari]